MFRVGIIGTENSHARQFLNIFTNNSTYPDIKVTHIGGMYKDSSEKLKEQFPHVEICENPTDMLGKVDAVMITCRDGKYHAKFAKPFIEKGIPAFIDKPFTCDMQEAKDLINLAKEKKVPLVGGSAVKLAYDILMLKNKVEENREKVKAGYIAAPLNMVNEWGNFYFYSSHLAEMTMTVFGYDPIEVTAKECNMSVTVITRYKDYLVTNQFTDGCNSYFGQVITADGIYSRDIDISLIFKSECESFANMLRYGEMDHTYEELIAPVRYLNAIEESYKTGKTIKI